jgi:hypothetical protein
MNKMKTLVMTLRGKFHHSLSMMKGTGHAGLFPLIPACMARERFRFSSWAVRTQDRRGDEHTALTRTRRISI